jgi:hypothetical protein
VEPEREARVRVPVVRTASRQASHHHHSESGTAGPFSDPWLTRHLITLTGNPPSLLELVPKVHTGKSLFSSPSARPILHFSPCCLVVFFIPGGKLQILPSCVPYLACLYWYLIPQFWV